MIDFQLTESQIGKMKTSSINNKSDRIPNITYLLIEIQSLGIQSLGIQSLGFSH